MATASTYFAGNPKMKPAMRCAFSLFISLLCIELDGACCSRVLLIGGVSTGGKLLKSVEVFDSERETFAAAAELPSKRAEVGAAAIAGFVYAIGGMAESGNAVAPSNIRIGAGLGQWETAPEMPTARVAPAVAASSNTIFAVGGGVPSFLLIAYSNLEAFSVETQAWSTLQPMPTRRFGAVAAVIGDYLYVAGGRILGRGDLNVVEKFSISSGNWSASEPMPGNRSLACGAVYDGRLFVFGGHSNDDASLLSAESYSTTTGTWMRLANMSTKRKGCGAATVGNLIYVFGGYRGTNEDGSYLDSVEVYNPATDTFRVLSATMKTARAFFGTARLPES